MRYRSWKDLRWDKPRYLQDKILHNQYDASLDCHEKFPIRNLVFIREPLSTIRSIIEMGQRRDIPNYSNTDWATKYYCDRLQKLVTTVTQLPPETWMYFDSTQLIENTTELLNQIAEFLSLSETISKNYQVFKGTGKGGIGDSSKYIHAGKILRLEKDRNEGIHIDIELIQRAEKVYAESTLIFKKLSKKSTPIT